LGVPNVAIMVPKNKSTLI